MLLHKLVKTTKNRKRVGRGGKRGRHCGRGKGGQKSRTGSTSEITAFFEGGQMPLVRRIPRRGFTNVFKKEFALVNLCDLELRYETGDVVNEATLREKGLIKGKSVTLIKVLGNGTLTKKLTVHVHAMSGTAVQAIQNAGGSFQLS